MAEPSGNRINLHENHFSRLSAIDPFRKVLAASTPSWECAHSMERDVFGVVYKVDLSSLAEFQAQGNFFRNRLRRLLKSIESQQTYSSFEQPTIQKSLEELAFLYSEFRRLLKSPRAWQDVHGEDFELGSKIERILKRKY